MILVLTSFYWQDGGVTRKEIDLDDPREKLEFIRLARRCYLTNGAVVVVGMNRELDPPAMLTSGLLKQLDEELGDFEKIRDKTGYVEEYE